MNDRITHAHETRTTIHAFIRANPGNTSEQIASNHLMITKARVSRCMRYLSMFGDIRREGRPREARYFAVTDNIRALEDIRAKVKQNGQNSCKPAPVLEVRGITRNVGGSLKSTNQGAQGAVRHSVWARSGGALS